MIQMEDGLSSLKISLVRTKVNPYELKKTTTPKGQIRQWKPVAPSAGIDLKQVVSALWIMPPSVF